jgi:hypothetical protein
MITIPPTQLPDDIEQKLLDGQRVRATHDLKEWRGITLNGAHTLVGRWLFERRQAREGRDKIIGPKLSPGG